MRLFCPSGHSLEENLPQGIFDFLGDSPEADHTKVVLDFALNSFLRGLITTLNPKTIVLKHQAPSPDVPPRKKELPSVHFFLDSEIS